MKRFLKYDTEIVKKENSPVDKNGLIKENIVDDIGTLTATEVS